MTGNSFFHKITSWVSLILVLTFLCLTGFGFSQSGISLKVGIYQNEPKLFVDEAGNPSGFWVELLNHIAQEEGWVLQYVPGTWEENVERLKAKAIDIMPDVAYNEDRTAFLDYSEESAYTSWSGVYVKAGTTVDSLLDLDGRRIAVMHQSVNYIGNSGIKSLLKAFDIEGIFIEKDSYAEVLEAVKNDEADAAVTSKDFAILHLAKYELISTPIIFQPATLYFTFPKGNADNSFLIDTIDGHIRALKGNESSTYYKLMTKWFNVQSEKFVIPQWVFWLLSVSILFISLLGVGSQLLRIRVKERTKALTLEIQRRKRFEDELYENKRLLEETVRERTAELKHSNEELERFAYITSHDLQEPLRMITSYLQLLESRYRDKIDSDANDFIFYAVDGAKRMQQLINDLLKYSRLDTHKKEHGPVDCNDVVNDVLSNLEIAIKESGADIQLMTLPVVTGDETQLRQIFQNLIGNAVKFKEDRPLKIAVNVNEDEEYWWFTVKDNGIGIEEKHFERIFQVFQRLHGSRQYDGNGIGLAICRKIVENHGGTITVSSKAGEGSRFTFSIAKRGSKHAGKNREFN